MAQKSVNIVNVRVDSTSIPGVLRFVVSRLTAGKKFLIVTPNPEQVVLAQKDPVFAKIISKADLALPDGIGLVAADKFLRLPKAGNIFLAPILYFAQGLGVGFSILFDRAWLSQNLSVIRGREMFLELVKLANKKYWRVYLVGGWGKVAERTKILLAKNYKGVIVKAGTGPILDNAATPINSKEKEVEVKIIKDITDFKPHLLFVGFGAPVQEKWANSHLPKLNAGGVMVVGGTFDYISGRKKLPPSWVADIGLEWLWRLIIGDQQVKRVINAFPRFAFLMLTQKLKG